MELDSIMLSEIIQTEKDKYCMIFHLYVESENTELKDTEIRMMVARTWVC